MRLSLRFLVPLVLALGAMAYAVVPLVDDLTLKWFVRDLEIRKGLIASAVQEPLAELLDDERRDRQRLQRVQELMTRILQDERLFGLGFCDAAGRLVYRSPTLPAEVGCSAPGKPQESGRVLRGARSALHVASSPVAADGRRLGELLIVHDMSFIEGRSADTRMYIVYLFAAIGAVIALITVVIAELSWRGWMAGIKALIRGRSLALRQVPQSSELRPIARDLQALVKDLESQRRARDESQISWVPETLRTILRDDLQGDEILIVSNREPYIHVHGKHGRIAVQRPASGLVTALEPVMRACSGTWIAHGSGNADRDVVDARDHVMVPPDRPSYRIRRVWMSREEEAGYYYGFANEGLWPLCHIAHTRPVFRSTDWEHYRTVNRRFAAAVERESRTENPIVLVQDYHFALLPRLIRARLPQATIITFWHIPWPNPESFSVCPWREELLEGLLGSSTLGFHTQVHCNNFFETVDRTLEARVDRETFSIHYRGAPTEVRRYPISIEWPPAQLAAQPSVQQCRAAIRAELGLGAEVRLAVGVDRLDYTKGILERFAAVERLLELEPQWIGRFALLQIAAPSRSSIEEYQSLDARVRAVAARINERFGTQGHVPIVLRIEHHDADRVYTVYRAADLCCVTSLHDGMNLVAKEFVAARDDERGVLILSQFTGAARELTEALIVNPYDTEQCAGALRLALSMPREEQQQRMRSMRSQIQEFNVYRWAGRMLLDAARMRNRKHVDGAKVIDLRRA